MKRLLLAAAAILIAFAGVAQSDVQKYAETITPAELKANLSILASDALEGRETGTRGQKMAAAFIAHHFEQSGLAAPVSGSFYQPFELYSITPGTIYAKTGTARYENFKEIVYYGSADSKGEVSADVVFAGKGTEEDYGTLNVKDKIVLIYNESLSFSIFSSIRKTVEVARSKGAKMVLVVSNTSTEDFTGFASQLKQYLSGGSLVMEKPNPDSPNKGIFFVDRTVAEKMLNTTFAKLTKAAAESPKKSLSKVKPGKLSYSITMSIKTVKTENVLGYMEGTDKKDEVLVITSHYDHVGINENSTAEDKINNGADDDGSGTVAVLQMAKAFAQAKQEGKGPRRSILFMTVSAEEQGLYGSEYYAGHPVYPLANTVADLNIDMIGRRDKEHAGTPDYVYVIGSDKLSSELHAINERNNATYTKLAFDYTYNDENHPTNLYKRSDHWNFAKHGIPIIFFFDGIHEDYHKVTDEVSKIEFDLLAKRAQAMFYTAWELANRDNRIVVDKK